MRESASNIALVCAEHASKVNPKYAKMKAANFVGGFVKKAFLGRRPDNNKEIEEHMWVKVTSVKGTKLVGELDNDPVTIHVLKCGDTVEVGLNEIEAFINKEGIDV